MTERGLIAIKHLSNGEITVHLPAEHGNYDTLCGMDNDDPNSAVGTEPIDVPAGRLVNCNECAHIYMTAKKFGDKDFAPHMLEK